MLKNICSFRSLCHHKWYTDFTKVSFKRRKQNCKYNRILISFKKKQSHAQETRRKYINRLTVVISRSFFFQIFVCVSSTIIMYYSYFEKLNISCFNFSLFPLLLIWHIWRHTQATNIYSMSLSHCVINYSVNNLNWDF